MFDSIIVKYFVTLIIGMTPILEIRGAIPVGVGLGLTNLEAFLVGFIGNIIPIYFIVKYIQPLFQLLGKVKIFKKIIDWATERATNKIKESSRLQNFTALGLFLFVAIPLPGTGAWVGSLIANFLGVPFKKAFWPLALGVLVAGCIVLAITMAAYGGFSALFQAVTV